MIFATFLHLTSKHVDKHYYILSSQSHLVYLEGVLTPTLGFSLVNEEGCHNAGPRAQVPEARDTPVFSGLEIKVLFCLQSFFCHS